jgi:hypothetical protein
MPVGDCRITLRDVLQFFSDSPQMIERLLSVMELPLNRVGKDALKMVLRCLVAACVLGLFWVLGVLNIGG